MTVDQRGVVVLLGVLLLGALLARSRRASVAPWLSGLATAGLALLLALRWIRAGRPPVFGTFETDLAETLVLLLLAPWLARRLGPRYLAGPLVIALLTLGHSLLLRAEITPVTISERSLWVDLHAVLAWICWALNFHALCVSFREAEGALALRLLGAGFVAQSAMGFSGVYYGSILFATPWSWDPIQTLGLLSWLLFAVVIHFRLLHNVTLYRQRYLLLVALAAFVVAAKLVIWLPAGQSFHSFELGSMATPPR